MVSRKKKQRLRVLQSLNPAPLNINPGKLISTSFRLNKKDRRHSGRYTPNIIKSNMKYSDVFESALEPQEAYDEWISYRDITRDITRRKKVIHTLACDCRYCLMAKEIKKDIEKKKLIRKARRQKDLNTNNEI